MLTGNNGILTQAQNAKNKTEEAEEKERIQLAVYDAQLGDEGYQDLTEENLQKAIDKEFGSGEVRVYPNEKNAFSFIFQNKEANYRLEKDGTINKIDIALKIYNIDDFENFVDKVNSGNTFENQYVYLMENMDLNNQEWNVIGSYADDTNNQPFAGIFEGNNRTINGLNINGNENVGLFVYNTGTIRDIILESGSITGTDRVSGIVAINKGTVENCHNEGVIINGQGKGVSGVIASNRSGIVTYCSNYTDIIGENANIVGGVVGGNNNQGKISNSYNTGNISGAYNVGGISGDNGENSIIELCYNIGNVTGMQVASEANNTNAGGITGQCYGKIIYCYNRGCVEIAGMNGGGIAGFSSSIRDEEAGVFNCYNVGEIKRQGSVLGNIVGGANSPVKNCYFSKEISDVNGAISVGENSDIEVFEKPISYMKTRSFVEDLNKDENVFIMDIGINEGYPIFRMASRIEN